MSDNEELSPSQTQSPKADKADKGEKVGKSKSETPKSNLKRGGGIELTAVESLLFFNIVRYNKDPSAVDWDQVAIYSNLKNAASAKVRFRQIQKKYGMEIITPTGVSSAGNHKRRAAVEGPIDAEDDEDVDETPSKAVSHKRPAPGTGRAKKAARKGTKKVPGEEQEQEQDEEQEEQRTAVAKGPGQDSPFVKREPDVKNTQFDHFSGSPFDGAAAGGQQQQHLPSPFNASHVIGQPHHHPMMQGMAFSQQIPTYTPQQMSKIRQMQMQMQMQMQQQRPQSAAYGNPFGFHAGFQMGGGPFGHQDPQSPSRQPRPSPQGLSQQDGSPVGYFGSPTSTTRPANLAVGTPPAGHAEDEQAAQRDAEVKDEE